MPMNFAAADLQSGLQSLKRTERRSAPKVTIQQRRSFSLASGDAGEISRYQAYVQLFNIERWLSQLGGATFETLTVDMTRADAIALAKCYETNTKGGGEQTAPPEGVLGELTGRLASAMASLDSSGGGCFVKTSSRSAKDFAEPSALRAAFAAAKEALTLSGDCGEGSSSTTSEENLGMAAMSVASMQVLTVPASVCLCGCARAVS